MLVRVVKLTFQDEHLDEFLRHFETVKWKVAQFPGCRGMRLIQDLDNPCLIMTYSEWEHVDALENYRHSELFQSIWPMIKPWFAAKPEAWSFRNYFDGFQVVNA